MVYCYWKIMMNVWDYVGGFDTAHAAARYDPC